MLHSFGVVELFLRRKSSASHVQQGPCRAANGMATCASFGVEIVVLVDNISYQSVWLCPSINHTPLNLNFEINSAPCHLCGPYKSHASHYLQSARWYRRRQWRRQQVTNGLAFHARPRSRGRSFWPDGRDS